MRRRQSGEWEMLLQYHDHLHLVTLPRVWVRSLARLAAGVKSSILQTLLQAGFWGDDPPGHEAALDDDRSPNGSSKWEKVVN